MEALRLEKAFPVLNHLLGPDLSDAEELWENQSELLAKHTLLLPQGQAFLNSRMHDSHVVSAKCQGANLILTLNDFSTSSFCSAALKLQGKPHFEKQFDPKRNAFPVSFKFEGLSLCDLCRISKNGKLLPVSLRHHLLDLDEFLYDEIRLISDEQIDIGILFWSKRRIKEDYYLVLRIVSKRLIISHDLAESFAGFLGKSLAPLFELYMRDRLESGRVFSWSCARDFLKAHTEKPDMMNKSE